MEKERQIKELMEELSKLKNEQSQDSLMIWIPIDGTDASSKSGASNLEESPEWNDFEHDQKVKNGGETRTLFPIKGWSLNLREKKAKSIKKKEQKSLE